MIFRTWRNANRKMEFDYAGTLSGKQPIHTREQKKERYSERGQSKYIF
jgi:hypothetical protein